MLVSTPIGLTWSWKANEMLEGLQSLDCVEWKKKKKVRHPRSLKGFTNSHGTFWKLLSFSAFSAFRGTGVSLTARACWMGVQSPTRRNLKAFCYESLLWGRRVLKWKLRMKGGAFSSQRKNLQGIVTYVTCNNKTRPCQLISLSASQRKKHRRPDSPVPSKFKRPALK